MNIIEKTKEEIIELSKTKESLVCVGTGGDLKEWVDGVNGIMLDRICTQLPEVFTEIYKFEQEEDITCLVFVFPKEGLDLGRLAIVRLDYPWMKWLSDFVTNYLEEYDLKNDDPFWAPDEYNPEDDEDEECEHDWIGIKGKRNLRCLNCGEEM